MTRISIIFLFIIFKTEAQTSVLNSADSLYLNGNYSQAIEQYKKYENQSEVYDKIAKSYIAIGNYDLALKNYRTSTENNPEDALVKFEYARLLSKTKKVDLAKKMFNELIAIDGNNPNYHYELGLVLEQLKDSTNQVAFNKAYLLDKTHQKAIYKIAKYHLQKRQYDSVDTYTNKGLEVYANNLKLINLKAQNSFWKQDYRTAIKWFKKLIELGEKSEFVYEKLSICYERHYDFKNVLENRLILLKFNPNSAENKYIIGTCFLELDDFKNAEKYISEALLALDQPLDREYMKLATALNRQKNYKASIAVLKKAIIENPSNEYAHFQLALTLELYYEDFDAKIKVFEDLQNRFPNSRLKPFIKDKISKLKKEKFIKDGEKED